MLEPVGFRKYRPPKAANNPADCCLDRAWRITPAAKVLNVKTYVLSSEATPHNSRLTAQKHRFGGLLTLPKCSIMSGCGTRIVLRRQKPLALCDRCPCFGSLHPPLAALTFAASSIICAFGLAPRSPYRHLELCGIALVLFYLTALLTAFIIKPISKRPSVSITERRFSSFQFYQVASRRAK